MWQCPKCKRTFKNTRQSHYCGEAPKSIEEYIDSQPEELRPALHRLNSTIKAALPQAEEKIAWGMPTYWKGCNLVQFAAAKKHIGFYPGAQAVEEFRDQLAEYKTNKGSIHLPYDKLPLELICEISRWCERNS